MAENQSTPALLHLVCVERGVVYRLERDGCPVGLVVALANGRWAICDMDERRIERNTYSNPQRAAEVATRMGVGA